MQSLSVCFQGSAFFIVYSCWIIACHCSNMAHCPIQEQQIQPAYVSAVLRCKWVVGHPCFCDKCTSIHSHCRTYKPTKCRFVLTDGVYSVLSVRWFRSHLRIRTFTSAPFFVFNDFGGKKSRRVCSHLLSSSRVVICSAADNLQRNVEFAFPVNQSFSPLATSDLHQSLFHVVRSHTCACVLVCRVVTLTWPQLERELLGPGNQLNLHAWHFVKNSWATRFCVESFL